MVNQQSTREASDGLITAKIRAALAMDPVTAEYEIFVETWNGVVELTGFVDTATARSEALQLAKYVEGVMRVQDSLELRRFD